MTNDFNLARDYICPLNYIVTWTDYILPLYRPTGYLAYNPVGNTLRLMLLGHTPDLWESLYHMAEVGPVGSDGQEIPVSLVYDQVALAAKYSQQDCRLDSLLDGIEEVCESK